MAMLGNVCEGVGRVLLPKGPGAFRLWLALVVVIHHLTRIEIGKAPVLVFFALSGFWVQRVWRERYASLRLGWGIFLASRWLRLFPVFAITGLASLAAHAWVDDADWQSVLVDWRAHAAAMAIIVGYAQLPSRPLGPAWSLDVEMQLYALAPLLAAMVARVNPKVVIGLGAGVFVVALSRQWGVVLPSFLVFFLMGMTAAQVSWVPSRRIGQGGLAIAGALLLGGLFVPSCSSWLEEGTVQAALVNMAIGLAVMPYALGTVWRRSDSIDAYCANQSYIIYLAHWPAIILLRHGVWGNTAPAVKFALLGGGTALFAHLIWRWVDRPADRARAAWLKTQYHQQMPTTVSS